MAHVLILGTSLDPDSRSQVLAREAYAQLRARKVSATLIDLRAVEMPHPARRDSFHHHHAVNLRAEATKATHLLIAMAIYNYAPASMAKSMIELMDKESLTGKTVGFLCAAGGTHSYMGMLPLANALMLDYHCWIVPRFVYATGKDFTGGAISNPEIIARIAQMTTEMFDRGHAAPISKPPTTAKANRKSARGKKEGGGRPPSRGRH